MSITTTTTTTTRDRGDRYMARWNGPNHCRKKLILRQSYDSLMLNLEILCTPGAVINWQYVRQARRSCSSGAVRRRSPRWWRWRVCRVPPSRTTYIPSDAGTPPGSWDSTSSRKAQSALRHNLLLQAGTETVSQSANGKMWACGDAGLQSRVSRVRV